MLTMLRKLIRRCALNIPCQFVYLGLSAIYAASCVGLDKAVLGAAAAVAYIALALASNH